MRKDYKDLIIQVGAASAVLLIPAVVEAFTGIDAGASGKKKKESKNKKAPSPS